MDKPSIIKVLEDAQKAHKAGDFVNALTFYEDFFDGALAQDPYAFYGARLSHCLGGWAELAEVFPGALTRLEAKKREVLEHYLEVREPERFHDYLAICRHLGREADAVEQFLTFHHDQPKSAAKLSKFLWGDLILAEQWSVCSDLMQQSNLKLEELFAVFDEANKLKDLDPAFNNVKFDKHIVDTLFDDLQKVVMVLRYSNRGDEVEALERQFHQGVAHREHHELNRQAHAKGSFLFAGH